MKASDLFVKALEAEGVQYVFGIPGEENLDLLESLRRSRIKLVLTRHEQAAGFMAATYGRLTGKTGVCLATLGPGATNFVTAAAYAQLGGMPMLMITGQKPIKSSKQGHFQIVDVVGMMQPLTKLTRQIVSIGNIPSAVREAFRRAEEERPGATHLELPEDIAHEEGDGKPIPASYSRRPIAEEKALARAVDAIQAARHPLLMIGAGGNRKTTCRMLKEFVDTTGIPFFTTQMGKGVIDETHPLWLGNATLSDGDFVHRAIEHADCIINVGHDVIEKPPFFMRADDKTVIHVNFLGAQVDPVYFPQIEVVGDIANAVWQMKEKLARQPHWDFSRFMLIKAHFDAHLKKGQDDPRFPMYPVRIVNDLYRSLPEDGIVCLDNGMYKIWFARYWRARAEFAAARQRARVDGRGAAVGDRDEDRASAAQGDRRVRRRRLHDEFSGARNGGAAQARSRRDDPARRCVRDDPLEAGEHEFSRLRDDAREPGFRRVCAELRRARAPDRVGRRARAARARVLRVAGRAPDRRADRLLGQRARAQSRNQAPVGAAVTLRAGRISAGRTSSGRQPNLNRTSTGRSHSTC